MADKQTTKKAPAKKAIAKKVEVEEVLEIGSTVLDTKYNKQVVVDKIISEAALRIPNRWK